MITEDYVSFEITKLLKEKGFDEECSCFYNNIDYGTPGLEVDGQLYYKNSALDDEEYATPTIQMAMKWLREVYNLLIVVDRNEDYYVWLLEDNKTGLSPEKTKMTIGENNSYEEACEAAIKYCLEKLI